MINVKEVVFQPIGSKNTIENFKKINNERWAESEIYREEWEKLEGKLVLFIKDGIVFSKAIITHTGIPKVPKNSKRPLNYYYKDIEDIDVAFSKISELISFSEICHTFKALNIEDSQSIISYLNFLKIIPYISDEDYQNDIEKLQPKELKDEAELSKDNFNLEGGSKYHRRASYAKSALYRANYQCEVNTKHITFVSKVSQENYVEAHHLIPLRLQKEPEFDYNLDVPANIVALCPNCHRKIHSGIKDEKNTMLDFLYKKHRDRLAIVKLDQEGLLDYLKEIY